MRAALGETQEAVRALARDVAGDLAVATTEELPPAGDPDRAWRCLAATSLAALRGSRSR